MLNNDLRLLLNTMKSAVVIRSTLVSRAFSINLKQRPISFLEILLIAQISGSKRKPRQRVVIKKDKQGYALKPRLFGDEE